MGVGKRAITSQGLRERPSEKVTKVGAFTCPPFLLSLLLLSLTIGWTNSPQGHKQTAILK